MAAEPQRVPSREKAIRALDAAQTGGLALLLLGLGVSEAAKSVGLAIAFLAFAGKLVMGYRPDRGGSAALVALGAFCLAAVLSMVFAVPGFGRPRELLTVAITVVAFPLVLDVCRRPGRRILISSLILTGACAAALLGYASHLAGSYKRLALGSIENAVAAGEYLAAVVAFGIPIVLAERKAPVAGPAAAFATGAAAIALGMTLSRGPLAGAAAGCAVALGVSLRRRYAFGLLAAAAVAVLALAVLSPGARVVSETSLQTRTAHSRLAAWEEAVDKWSERPLTGHGPGTYALLDVYYDDGVHGPEHQPNAHNLVLNTAAELGVIGCGTLLLFLVLSIRGAVRSVRGARWRLERAVFVGSLAGVTAILVSGVFSVSIDAEPGILFFSLLGLGMSGVTGVARTSGAGNSLAGTGGR